jgi:hypothetical protein
VPVIQHQRILALHQAGSLQLGNFLQAIGIELDGEAARQQRRARLQMIEIVWLIFWMAAR